jgi:murein DD-endopeptidase MepM/ murein hydrolase activator NlpD
VVALRWPHRGVITTYFGEVGPLSPKGHAGLDVAGSWGEPILAAADGTVVDAGFHPAYGNNVIIFHANGLSTRYGHLARILVTAGQRVSRGQEIGALGSTGYSTGPHLHFEVRRDGVLQDPLTLLPGDSGL